MLWLFVWPMGVDLLDFCCSVIQFYLLSSSYLCFIYFLYLDLYVLRDDALISYGSFMQTNHLSVLIHIWTKGEVGTPSNRFKHSSKIFLLTVPRRYFFCGSFIFFCFVFAMHLYARLFICALLSPAAKELTSWISFVVSYCELVTFPLVSLVRCGTWLYQFLILAPLLTLMSKVFFQFKSNNDIFYNTILVRSLKNLLMLSQEYGHYTFVTTEYRCRFSEILLWGTYTMKSKLVLLKCHVLLY